MMDVIYFRPLEARNSVELSDEGASREKTNMSNIAAFPRLEQIEGTREPIEECLRKALLALDVAYMQAHLCIGNIRNPLARQRLLMQSEGIASQIDAARQLVRSM
jgi:hypothetical protein